MAALTGTDCTDAGRWIASRHSTVAIDPGPERSALVELADGWIQNRRILANEEILDYISAYDWSRGSTLVCEMIESYGMPVGAEVFETCWWIGRYAQAAKQAGLRFERMSRGTIKLALCGSKRAKDANVRRALLDLFGGDAARGTKKAPGILYGFKGDLWAALAVLVTWCEREGISIRGVRA